jgi:hypothetical protein
MLVEYNSLCFNPRGHLYRDRALQDVIKRVNVEQALVEFAKLLAEIPWGLYRVRRIYTKKGKAMRHVEKMDSGTRLEMESASRGLMTAPHTHDVVTKRNIVYQHFAHREAGVYPTREGYYVVAPAFMDDKLRGTPAKFDRRWIRVGLGLPLYPPKPSEVPAGCGIMQRANEEWIVYKLHEDRPDHTGHVVAGNTNRALAIKLARKNIKDPVRVDLESLREPNDIFITR